MLAVASLAAGVVTSLLTPSSHAVGDGLPEPGALLGTDDVMSLVDRVSGEAAPGAAPRVGGETVQH